MPTFDIVSKTDLHEVSNAVDQANREVGTRFDFKDTHAHYELSDNKINMVAPSDFHLKQMKEILTAKLSKRDLDSRSFEYQNPTVTLKEARQSIDIKQGLAIEVAKDIVKRIKNTKMKVQAGIQGDSIRVSGKKRDDLQEVMAFLRAEKIDVPLQFDNFRD